MGQTEPSAMSPEPLLLCLTCGCEMRLFGVEAEKPDRDLFTFACSKCGRLEVRGVSTV